MLFNEDDDCPKSATSFHKDQNGQISVLFAISLLTAVFLMALIYNTARQTSRKIQMQGAADSAAVAGGVWMARGMNLMALDNKTMADVLSIMVVVRSIVQTEEVMVQLLGRAAVACPVIPEICVELERYGTNLLCAGPGPCWRQIDHQLSDDPGGIGWGMMRGLDTFNKAIKLGVPVMAEASASTYAYRNGADRALFPAFKGSTSISGYSLLVSGQPDLFPLLPVVRGPSESLAGQADICGLNASTLLGAALKVMVAGFAFVIIGPASAILAEGVFWSLVDKNVKYLMGEGSPFNAYTFGVGDVVETIYRRITGHGFPEPVKIALNLLGALSGIIAITPTSPLEWPDDRPRPMLLTDSPKFDPSATEDEEKKPDLAVVRKYLQLLALAFGEAPQSPFGGERFPTLSWTGWVKVYNPWLTYGEADVYNPQKWDMYDQHWKAKLSRARVLEDQSDKIAEELGMPDSLHSLFDFSFVNTH